VSEWYPILLNLKDRACVVVGGGTVAARKTKGLLDAGAVVRVISPALSGELNGLADAGKIEFVPRTYAGEGDLVGATLVFAATDRPEVNAAIASDAQRRGVPVNVADGSAEGDFIVPAVLRRGELVLTASASGAGPAVAARIIGELSSRYGPEYAQYLNALRKLRTLIKAEVSDPIERRKLLEAASTEPSLIEFSQANDWTDKKAVIERIRVRALGAKG